MTTDKLQNRSTAIINEVIEQGGHRWKVRQAESLGEAKVAISYALATGSIGHIDERTSVDGDKTVTADVVRLDANYEEATGQQESTRSFRVGRFLQPEPNDPAVSSMQAAHAEAERQSAQCDKTAIAIWADDSETLALYLNGERFVQD